MSKALRILVVEDKEGTIPGTIKKLRMSGHDITAACNVDEARKCLQKNEYDLMWLDFRLPLDGDDTGLSDYAGEVIIQRLRNGDYGEKNARVPFIVVTAQSRSVNQELIRAAGSCLGTFKKIEHVKILEAIEELCKEGDAA